jgi:hypothetical protein
LSSDGGVMLLAQAERRLGIAERLARVIPDWRDPERVKHAVPDMIRARIFAIACGYEDCNDFGPLRADPAFKLACGHLPETGADLASQPTPSRRHRQLNDLRQVHPFKSIRSGTRDTGHLGPDSEGLSSGCAVSGSGGVCGTAEEVGHLIVD